MHPPEFITEMKQKLEVEQTELKKELANLGRTEDGDTIAKFPEYGRDSEDNATEIADYGARYSTTEALEARLNEVQAALTRIDEGTYGKTSTGDLIPEDRLRANPAATTLVE